MLTGARRAGVLGPARGTDKTRKNGISSTRVSKLLRIRGQFHSDTPLMPVLDEPVGRKGNGMVLRKHIVARRSWHRQSTRSKAASTTTLLRLRRHSPCCCSCLTQRRNRLPPCRSCSISARAQRTGSNFKQIITHCKPDARRLLHICLA